MALQLPISGQHFAVSLILLILIHWTLSATVTDYWKSPIWGLTARFSRRRQSVY